MLRAFQDRRLSAAGAIFTTLLMLAFIVALWWRLVTISERFMRLQQETIDGYEAAISARN